jgi:hypothetical protein
MNRGPTVNRYEPRQRRAAAAIAALAMAAATMALLVVLPARLESPGGNDVPALAHSKSHAEPHVDAPQAAASAAART